MTKQIQLRVKNLEETLENVRKTKYFVACDSESALFVTTTLLNGINFFIYHYIALFGEDGNKLDEWKILVPDKDGDPFILTDDF